MSFIGMIVALICIVGGNLLEGGHPAVLLNLPAFLIVIGATVGAALTQFPFHVVIEAGKRFMWLVIPLRLDMQSRSVLLQEMASLARKGGFLALEEKLDSLDDPFLKRGIGMLVDGFDKDYILETLEQEIEMEQEEIEHTVKFYESMGGYAPTMGIVGAVLGLIHAMGMLDKPDQLGGAIGVAFVATIYGVAFANLMFLPFGNRYKGFAAQIRNYKTMTLIGIIIIADGLSPQQLQIRLAAFTGQHDEKEKPEPPENHERWLVSYADYMTLLFALFVVLYSFAMAKQSEYNAMVKAFMDSMGRVGLISRPVGNPVLEGGTGILEVEQKSQVEKKEENKQDLPESTKESLIPEVAIDLNAGNAEINAPEDMQKNQSAAMVSKRKDQKEMLGKLQKQFQNKRVEVEQLGQQLVIRITDTTLFPAGSAFLQPRLAPLIDEIATVLKDIPGTVIVTGHTDNLQEFDSLYKSNWELSSLRAVAVVQEMLKNKDLQPNRIIAQGRADTKPLVDNNSPENRAKNRRIEIVVTQGEAEEVKAVTVEKGKPN